LSGNFILRGNKLFKAILLLVCVFSRLTGYSQEDGQLTIQGTCERDGKELPGAIIYVFENNVQVADEISINHGKFKVKLEYGRSYIIRFSFVGCYEMFMTVNANMVKEEIWRDAITEIPVVFYDKNNPKINKKAFKMPFTKIAYNPKEHKFTDDISYLETFSRELYKVEMEEEEAASAKKIDNTKQDQAALAAKTRHEAAMAAQKVKEEETANTPPPIKNEEKVVENIPAKTSNETDEMALLKEKQEKEKEQEKNKQIKTENENSILQLVAEGEKMSKQGNAQEKEETTNSMMVERMKQENELKQNFIIIREQEIKQQEKILYGKSKSADQFSELILAAATNEKSMKMGAGKQDQSKTGRIQRAPEVLQTLEQSQYKTIRTTKVTFTDREDIYKKIEYVWGTKYYYKNNSIIEQETYETELKKYNSKI
jgi:hypothetical protein